MVVPQILLTIFCVVGQEAKMALKPKPEEEPEKRRSKVKADFFCGKMAEIHRGNFGVQHCSNIAIQKIRFPEENKTVNYPRLHFLWGSMLLCWGKRRHVVFVAFFVALAMFTIHHQWLISHHELSTSTIQHPLSTNHVSIIIIIIIIIIIQ